MPLARVLRAQAVIFASSCKSDLADLAVEKQVLEVAPNSPEKLSRLHQVDEQIQLAEDGISRLHEYNPEFQRPFECPYCWIIEGAHTRLQPAVGKTEAAACPDCAAEYSLE